MWCEVVPAMDIVRGVGTPRIIWGSEEEGKAAGVEAGPLPLPYVQGCWGCGGVVQGAGLLC